MIVHKCLDVEYDPDETPIYLAWEVIAAESGKLSRQKQRTLRKMLGQSRTTMGAMSREFLSQQFFRDIGFHKQSLSGDVYIENYDSDAGYYIYDLTI